MIPENSPTWKGLSPYPVSDGVWAHGAFLQSILKQNRKTMYIPPWAPRRKNMVQSHYNTINVLKNIHDKHPIACPSGRHVRLLRIHLFYNDPPQFSILLLNHISTLPILLFEIIIPTKTWNSGIFWIFYRLWGSNKLRLHPSLLSCNHENRHWHLDIKVSWYILQCIIHVCSL